MKVCVTNISGLGRKSPRPAPLLHHPTWGKTSTPDSTHKRAYVGAQSSSVAEMPESNAKALSKRKRKMAWYAAHAIVSIRPNKAAKGEVLVYENVILVEAENDRVATRKARRVSKASIPKDDSLQLNGEPATESFIGIRKIIAVSNPWPASPEGDRPSDGTEITYSKFTVKDARSLSKLVKGEEVSIRYLE